AGEDLVLPVLRELRNAVRAGKGWKAYRDAHRAPRWRFGRSCREFYDARRRFAVPADGSLQWPHVHDFGSACPAEGGQRRPALAAGDVNYRPLIPSSLAARMHRP